MCNRLSPCMGCTRVEDPRDCDNKNCMLWQKWFLARWENLRKQFLGQVPPSAGGGGGCAKPFGVRAYYRQDPCSSCVCNKELCYEPCPSRRSWEMERQDVFL